MKLNRNVYLDDVDINEFGNPRHVFRIETKLKKYSLVADHVFMQCSAPLKRLDIYNFIMRNQRLIRSSDQDISPVICFPLSRDVIGYSEYYNHRVAKIEENEKDNAKKNKEYKAYLLTDASSNSRRLDSVIPLYNIKRKELSVDKIFRNGVASRISSNYFNKIPYPNLSQIVSIVRQDPFFQTFYFEGELRKFGLDLNTYLSIVSGVRSEYYLANKLGLGIVSQKQDFLFLERNIDRILNCIGIYEHVDKLTDTQILLIRGNRNFQNIIDSYFKIVEEINLIELDQRLAFQGYKYFGTKVLTSYFAPLLFSLFSIPDIAKAVAILGSYASMFVFFNPLYSYIEEKITGSVEDVLLANYGYTYSNLREFRLFFKREVLV